MWIDELLAKLHSIYGQKWNNHVSGIPYEALRSTWGEALAGWSKADAKRALDHCMNTMPWPPALPDFLTAKRAGMTDEQRAQAARLAQADADRLALPSRTSAEARAEGRRQARELMASLLQQAEERQAVRDAEPEDEPVPPEQVARMDAAKRKALDDLAALQAKRGGVECAASQQRH